MTPPAELLFLGGATLRHASGTTRRLERKSAGLLAYLGVEGPTPRTTLAGLLWPDSLEAQARNNLRQTLHRLKDTAGTTLLRGDEILSLHPDIQVDVALLELAAFDARDDDALALTGELLDGYTFDECPEFTEWLAFQRERLGNLRRDAHLRRSEASEAAGDDRAALRHAERLLELDPVSEVAHRRVMRLHQQLGDRGAALQAFQRCQAVLQRELGVPPLPETVALARQIEANEPLPAPQAPRASRTELPPSVQRPPLLVGRDPEWARMEAAWHAGQVIYLAGPPGVGKTRLAQDFLAGRGEPLTVAGQLGGGTVPYGTLARTLRQVLRADPHLPLPGWVRAELARLLPDLGPAATPGEAQQVRFLEAVSEFLALALTRRPAPLLLDDLQFNDHASAEALNYALFHPTLRARPTRALLTYRPAELPDAGRDSVTAAVAAGQAILIDLPPLPGEAVTRLLDSLALPAPPGLGAALTRHTGGNPLFVLETLRSMIESGDLAHADPTRLPLPRRLGPLVARRLERLSSEAQRLVGAAAVAGPDFTAELAGAVLVTHPLNLAGPWAELVQGQVLDEQGFTHDLLAEAALAALPAAIRVLLHGRVAAHLETAAAEPARVAHHWQQAGESARAAPWWLRAGLRSAQRGSGVVAAQAFEQVLSATAPGSDLHLDALAGLGQARIGTDPAQAEAPLRALLDQAVQGRQRRREVEAHAALSEMHLLRGQLPEALSAIEQAIALVPPTTPSDDQSELWRARFWIELRSGRLDEAEQSIDRARDLSPTHPWLANEHALLLWHAGRFREAAAQYDALLGRADDTPDADQGTLAWIGNNVAWTYWALARNAEAAALLRRTLDAPSAPFDRGLRQSNLAVILTSQGAYTDALHELHEARTRLSAYPLHLVDVLHRTGMVHYRADRFDEAAAPLREALPLARRVGDPYRLSYTLASLGATETQLRHMDAAAAHVQEALAITARIHFPMATVFAHQAAALHALQRGEAHATDLARTALTLARACHMPEQIAYSLLLHAQTTGQADRAPLREALRLARTHDLPELRWRAATALNDHAETRAALDTLRAHAPAGWFPDP